MMDSAYALAFGTVFATTFALFYAINLFRYKIAIGEFDSIFRHVIATIILLTSIFLSNLGQVASRFEKLDHNNWLSDRGYQPYTKFLVLIAILLYVKDFVGERYPKVWLYCSAIAVIVSILAYVLLT